MKSKKIWITSDWEVNPLLEESAQLGRMFRLAGYLADSGYDVTVWFTTYSHPKKEYVEKKTVVKSISSNYKIVLLHSKVRYKTNMSPWRFVYHSFLANEMKKMMSKFTRPDIILCSYPPEQFCTLSIRYGKKNHIPVIVDARDQWPDIFERAFPTVVRPMANLLLVPLKIRAQRVFSQATALCAMSPIQLKWALRYARRKKTDLDRYVFIGSRRIILEEDKRSIQLKKWNEMDVSTDTWNICLFSTLSKTALDLDTVIRAIKIVHETHPQIRLVVGGRGDDEERLKLLVKDMPYIIFAGWLNQEEMSSLMFISKMGLLCYRNTKDFKDGWGNKVGQYLSYGLPLLTSAEGYAKTYINRYDCGIYYQEGNVSDLARILGQIINSSKEWSELTKNALKCFEKDFEESVVLEKFKNMIEDVMIRKAQ